MIATTDCMFCKHARKGERTCAAFPDGIPDAILFDGHSHRDPYPGDHGIQLALKDDVPLHVKQSARYNKAV